jgi:hypothetical protein
MARAIGEEPDRTRAALDDVGPDSTHLRISRNTKHESGIPPASESLGRGQRQLEHALSEVARTEANLQSLVRGLRHLTAGANAALEATGGLASEFDALRELLDLATNDAGLKQRIFDLSAALERARADARAERARLLEEEDRFLLELLNDHERELYALEQRLAGAGEKQNDERIAELTAQRDQARAYALQCERERDLAWRDLGVQTPAPHVTTRPSAPERKKTPIALLRLRPSDPSNPAASESRPTTRRSAEYSVVDGEERVPESKPAP